MTGREVYEIWAKEGAKWTDWVRPVPFIAIDDNAQIMEFYDLNIPDIFYLKEIFKLDIFIKFFCYFY